MPRSDHRSVVLNTACSSLKLAACPRAPEASASMVGDRRDRQFRAIEGGRGNPGGAGWYGAFSYCIQRGGPDLNHAVLVDDSALPAGRQAR